MGLRKPRTKLGAWSWEQSAKEILAHVRGDVKLPTRRIVIPDEIGVKRNPNKGFRMPCPDSPDLTQ
jgi:hypothetical protein